MTAISTIRNLGPAMQAELNAAGIPTAEALARSCGADEAYRTIAHALGRGPISSPITCCIWRCKAAHGMIAKVRKKRHCVSNSMRWSLSTAR
jgi:hypothetical protein